MIQGQKKNITFEIWLINWNFLFTFIIRITIIRQYKRLITNQNLPIFVIVNIMTQFNIIMTTVIFIKDFKFLNFIMIFFSLTAKIKAINVEFLGIQSKKLNKVKILRIYFFIKNSDVDLVNISFVFNVTFEFIIFFQEFQLFLLECEKLSKFVIKRLSHLKFNNFLIRVLQINKRPP